MPIRYAMDVPPALLQFLGSLAAILLLAALAWWLKLGAQPRIETEGQAREAAAEVEDGFCAVEVALDRDGRGALLRDAAGRVMLLRPHGSHFAGRILVGGASAVLDASDLHIDTLERRFGTCMLRIHDPSAWVQHIRAIGQVDHA